MRRRDRWSLFTIALLLIGLGLGFYLMTLAPPRPACYLPKASGIVYIDLKPLRAAGVFERNRVSPDDDYQQFINDTGIDFERDLDEAAFALNEIPASESTSDRRISYSEVLVGRFDSTRLSGYLSRIANEREHYSGIEIYNIQMPGRIDRVSILGSNTVAISNAPGADEIHSIIDRQKRSLFAVLPFQQQLLLRRYHSKVPMASLIWAILRLKSSPQDDGLDLRHMIGYGFLFPPQTTVVASSRYVGSVQVRAEAFTQSAQDAEKIVSSFNVLLDVLKNSGTRHRPSDLSPLLNNIKFEQQDKRAVFTATIPEVLLKEVFGQKP